jgi:FKBP-type peptidyl-prolyl cis-trans isomerase
MWQENFVRRGWVAARLTGIILLLQGCLGTDNTPDYDPYEYLEKDIETIRVYLDENNIDAELDSLTGIYIEYHTKGEGYRTLNGIEIEAHWQGLTLEGTEFVNNFSGAPERVILGRDGNHPSFTGGLNISLTKMSEGDSATIYVPSPYGFQDMGYQNVPPNTVIIYNVKFKDILLLSEDLGKIDQYIDAKSWTPEIDSIYGLRYVIHQPGDQQVPIELGDYISLDYTGLLLDDTEFDSSTKTAPLQLYLGQEGYRMIIGFEIGLTYLHDKDSATIFLPSIYAYGENGSGEVIPSNASLVFGINVRNVTKPF